MMEPFIETKASSSHLLPKLGVLQDVGQDLDGVANVRAQALGVEDSLLPGRVGIQVSSHVLDLELQLRLRPLRRPLEGHVLEEVSDTIVGRGLVAGSGVDPEADGGRGSAGVLCGHPHAIVEHGHLGGRNIKQILTQGSGLSGQASFSDLSRKTD